MKTFKEYLEESRADPMPKGFRYNNKLRKKVHNVDVSFDDAKHQDKFSSLLRHSKPHTGGGETTGGKSKMTWNWSYASKKHADRQEAKVKKIFNDHKVDHKIERHVEDHLGKRVSDD